MHQARIAVTQLTDLLCRSGDLYSAEYSPSATEGSRAHKHLQQRRRGWRSEVAVDGTVHLPQGQLRLRGRIDTLYRPDQGEVIIEEIKTRLDALPETPAQDHLWQLLCYGYLYARQYGLSSLRLRLTYYQLHLDREQHYDSVWTLEEMQAAVQALGLRFFHWYRRVQNHRALRNTALKDWGFPLGEFRPGQRGLAAAVFSQLRQGAALLAEAPTGTGKTAATLFPALKALGHGHCDQVLYLSAKGSGQRAALQFSASAAQLCVLQLGARTHLCHCDDPLRCDANRGFYDRLAPALDALWQQPQLDHNALRAYAAQFQLCPHGLAMAAAPWVDLVIGDYNYAVDPSAQLTSVREPDQDLVLLFDEAHNLPERSRDALSVTLSIDRLRQQSRHPHWPTLLRRRLARLTRTLQALRDALPAHGFDATPPVQLIPQVEALLDAVTRPTPGQNGLFTQNRDQALWDLSGQCRDLLAVLARWDTQYRVCREADNGFSLRCCDAAPWLSDLWQRARGVVMFSASLRPLAHYREQCGLPDQTPMLSLPSPFPRAHLCVLTAPWIDTRYRARERHHAEIATLIRSLVQARTGHYLAALPSYAYLTAVQSELALAEDMELWVQTPAMGLDQRDHLINAFTQTDGRTRLALVISGGIFAEGIDLPGEQLIGAVVVGRGLPQVSPYRAALAEVAQQRGHDGFDSAYIVPGLARVLQTAGRVIRSETDRGVLLLIDRSYAAPETLARLPEHWHPSPVDSAAALQDALEAFWSECETAPSRLV